MAVVTAPTVVFIANSVEVYVYGRGKGESNSLPVGLDIKVLNIGVFYCPSPPPRWFSPRPVLSIVIVASLTTMRPPPRLSG